MTQTGGEDVEHGPALDEANIRWLLAAVLHHDPASVASTAPEPEEGPDGAGGPSAADYPGGGSMDTSRSGGYHPSGP